MLLLAVETSCDETAVSIFDIEQILNGHSDYKLLYEKISSQVKLHEPYGGVVPELAAREHVRNLPLMVSDAFTQIEKSTSDIRAIAVTSGPGLNGCLLVGVSFCKAMAASLGVPLISLHHIEGHLFAGTLLEEKTVYPQLALVVSGGHTELVLINGLRRYKIIARTRDDAAGEAFDKIASLLSLPYPGGPSLSKRASQGSRSAYALPMGAKDDDTSFSFSGLKTAVLRLTKEVGALDDRTVDDISASAEEAICQALMLKTKRALEKHRVSSLLLTGGVAANKRLRELFTEVAKQQNLQLIIPPMAWCTDNATMMGALAIKFIEKEASVYRDWKPVGGQLGPDTSVTFGATPRWPIENLCNL